MEPNAPSNPIVNNMPISNVPVNPASPAPQAPQHDDNGHKKVGPIIATLVIVLILIIAALYLFASRINQQSNPIDDSGTAVVENVPTTATTTSISPVTGTATDATSLQNDLNSATKGLDSQNF